MIHFLRPVLLLCILGFQATVADEIIYAQVGEDVSLNLSYDSNKYFTWFFANEQIATLNPFGGKQIEPGWVPHLTLSHNSLVVKNLTQSDFGIFSCSVRDKRAEVGKNNFRLIQLNVAVDRPVLLPGETLSLTCGVRSQEYTPQISWLDPRGEKQGSAGRAVVQVTSAHSGEWTCVVSRAGKEKRVKIKVTVIDLLPLAPIEIQYASTSTPLTIPCSLAEGTTWDQVKSKGIHEVGWNFCPPKPQCDKPSLFLLSLVDNKPTWKKLTDRALRPSPNPGRGDLSLGRNLAREEDGGDYECFVKFQNGVTLNRTVRVEVLRIIASPGTQLTTGQELNLTCTTGHPLPPDIQIKWIPPRQSSSSSSTPPPPALLSPFTQDLGSPHLTVEEVGSDHNGTWTCELRRGETSLTSAAVVLKIESKFSAWMLVTLCAAAAILILLVILIIILQRRRQRRTRRHMRLCHCKNPKPKGFYRS